jgi:hypothetical protein
VSTIGRREALSINLRSGRDQPWPQTSEMDLKFCFTVGVRRSGLATNIEMDLKFCCRITVGLV